MCRESVNAAITHSFCRKCRIYALFCRECRDYALFRVEFYAEFLAEIFGNTQNFGRNSAEKIGDWTWSLCFPGTSYGKSAGENAEVKNTFVVRHFIKILKVPGKVRMQKKHFFGRHFAEVQDTFFYTYYKSFEL